MIAKEKKTVEFFNYDSSWETEAQKTISQLKGIFKEHAEDIQHIGGTAMKKIKSKPVIDIIVGVNDLNIIDSLKGILKAHGFICNFKTHAGDGEKILLFKLDDSQNKKTHVIYVARHNSKLWFDYIIFRDYINANSNRAREFEALKLSVNRKYRNALPSYIKAKADFISKTVEDNFYKMMLGKKVTVKTVGADCETRENENYNDNDSVSASGRSVYTLTHGYIKNLQISAYFMGTQDYTGGATDEFTGEITAYIRRGGAEKSFIAAKGETIFYKPDIYEAARLYFQIQNGGVNIGGSDIVCLHEKSCGAVVYTKNGGGIKFLLVRGSASNSVGFPKGHIEKGETEAEAAVREIYEETSLKVVLDSGFKEEYQYIIGGYVHKKVVCFLAEFDSRDSYKIRDKEILEQLLVPYEKAYELLTFSQAREILKKAYEKIKQLK